VTAVNEDLWRGRSSAVRAQERRERLLAAGMELFGTIGSAETTLRGVCRGAGVGLRYFYESFADVNELLVAVYNRVADALTQEVIDRIAVAPPGPQARTRAAFEAAVDFLDEDSRRGRILFRETLANDVLREHGTATVPQFVALVMTALAEESPDVGEVAASRRTMQISALSGALVALFLDRQAATLTVTRQELVDYCAELTRTVMGSDLGG
jgi:AcrR family transcriptional regulator